jgi:hypothetical protein
LPLNDKQHLLEHGRLGTERQDKKTPGTEMRKSIQNQQFSARKRAEKRHCEKILAEMGCSCVNLSRRREFRSVGGGERMMRRIGHRKRRNNTCEKYCAMVKDCQSMA